MLLFSGCGAKKVNPFPAPVEGKDIMQLKKGETAPFDGTIFSPFYLETYLEWKNK